MNYYSNYYKKVLLTNEEAKEKAIVNLNIRIKNIENRLNVALDKFKKDRWYVEYSEKLLQYKNELKCVLNLELEIIGKYLSKYSNVETFYDNITKCYYEESKKFVNKHQSKIDNYSLFVKDEIHEFWEKYPDGIISFQLLF